MGGQLSNAHGGESYGEELLQKVCNLLQIDEPRYIIVRSFIPHLCKYDVDQQELLWNLSLLSMLKHMV